YLYRSARMNLMSLNRMLFSTDYLKSMKQLRNHSCYINRADLKHGMESCFFSSFYLILIILKKVFISGQLFVLSIPYLQFSKPFINHFLNAFSSRSRATLAFGLFPSRLFKSTTVHPAVSEPCVSTSTNVSTVRYISGLSRYPMAVESYIVKPKSITSPR